MQTVPRRRHDSMQLAVPWPGAPGAVVNDCCGVLAGDRCSGSIAGIRVDSSLADGVF